MLVLFRKVGQSIWVGENIVITLVDNDHRGARLGIEAPKDVPIYRDELIGTVAESSLAARAVAEREEDR